MVRTEPRLAWTTPAGPLAPEPERAPPRSRVGMREALWGLALSVLFHALLVGAAGSLALATRNRELPRAFEVAVITAVPDPATAAPPVPASPPPQPPQEPSQSQEAAKPEAPPAEAEPRAQAVPPPAPPVEIPKPASAQPVETSAPTVPPSPSPDAAVEPPPPEASPPKAQVAEKPVPEPKQVPPAKSPARSQVALRPPPELSRNFEAGGPCAPIEKVATANRRILSCPPAQYPLIAVQLGEEGTVHLSVAIGADGRPEDITIEQSSGFGSLDQAAVQMMRNWHFEPRAGGGAASRLEIPVVFHLKHAGG